MADQKSCPVCGEKFECSAGNIVDCQCYPVSLTPEERLTIRGSFGDCLCACCLLGIKAKLLEFEAEQDWRGKENLLG